MLIPHPLLGLRDAQEFTYLGDASLLHRPNMDVTNPDDPEAHSDDTLQAIEDYVFLRENPAGIHEELWFHEQGDRSWLLVTRDTVTHEILGAELASRVALGFKEADK